MATIREIRARLRSGTEDEIRNHARDDIAALFDELARVHEELAEARLDALQPASTNTVSGSVTGTLVQSSGPLYGVDLRM